MLASDTSQTGRFARFAGRFAGRFGVAGEIPDSFTGVTLDKQPYLAL